MFGRQATPHAIGAESRISCIAKSTPGFTDKELQNLSKQVEDERKNVSHRNEKDVQMTWGGPIIQQ